MSFLNKFKKNIKTTLSQKDEKGFTLIEMIIAISIFGIVTSVALGGMFAVLDSNRYAQALESSMANLNFSLESLSRDLKFGQAYFCGAERGGPWENDKKATQDGNSCDSLAVTFNEKRVLYYLDGGVVMKVEYDEDDNQTKSSPVTAIGEVEITGLSFSVRGAGADQKQPYVFITIVGSVDIGGQKDVGFELQSTASQRVLDEIDSEGGE